MTELASDNQVPSEIRELVLKQVRADLEFRCRKPWTWYSSENETSLHASMRAASALHLADLKRAEHSPTQTELHIEPERGLMHTPHKLPEYSYCGSSAATCAGF